MNKKTSALTSKIVAHKLAQDYWYNADTILSMMSIIDRAKELNVFPQFSAALTTIIRSDVVGTMENISRKAKGQELDGPEN